MPKNRREDSSVEVDLTGVETGRKLVPEGRFPVVVSEAKRGKSKADKPKISFEFEVEEGKSSGSKLYEEASLQPQALFKLKSILMALGVDIPKGPFKLNPKDLIGLNCEVEVAHESYEGKKKSVIVEYYNSEDSEEDGEDEENLEAQLMDMDLEELQDLAKELEIGKADIKKAKKVKALVELIMDTSEEDDIREALGDESEDEDGEDYSKMSLSELKAECKERELKVKKNMDKDDLIEMLEADDEE